MPNGDAGRSGRLTTHALDTAAGRPAAGLKVELFLLDGAKREQLKADVTNQDGRCEAPLLDGSDFLPGRYEIVFHVGAYFRSQGAALADPAFLEEVPVRFGIAEPEGHYHVPLLISPYGYSTYRGS